MRIALVQLAVGPNPEKNRARARELLDQAHAAGAELAVLPELWTTGYAWDAAEAGGEPTLSLLRRWALELDLAVAGSVLEREDQRLYNRLRFHTPKGEAARYDKVHLFPPFDEPRRMTPGGRLAVAHYGGFTLGFAICFDLRFPELFRSYALKGVNLFVVPSAWPAERHEAWVLFLRARAAENQAYVVGVNHAEPPFLGRSLAVGPSGEVLAELDSEEGIATFEADPKAVAELRRAFPVLPLRRPEIYEGLG